MPRPQGNPNTGGVGNTTPTPDVYIEPQGGNVFLDSPPGLNTMGYNQPVTFVYREEGNPETDLGSYNYVKWEIFSSLGHGLLYEIERNAQQGSGAANFVLPSGVKGLNLSDIEDYLEPNVEKYGVSIRCTPSLITTDENDSEIRQDGNTATFLLDLQVGDGDKSTSTVDEDGNVTLVDPDGVEGSIQELVPLPPGTPNYAPFKGTILEAGTESNGNEYIVLDESWNEFKSQLPETTIDSPGYGPGAIFQNYVLSFKSNDKEDLSTYLHFGDDNIFLTTNVVTDAVSFPRPPHSAIFKMYEPLPPDVDEKDMVYVCKEILPQLTETVELVSYDPEDDVNDVKDIVVLRTADTLP